MIHPTTHRWSRVLFAPVIKCFEYLSAHHPVLLMRIRYFLLFHRFPNLKHPRNLNEKILYLKLFTDTTSWVNLTDKYRVRRFVESRGLSRILVQLYAVWHSDNEISLDSLPNAFILKANNGGGNSSCRIVPDKAALSEAERDDIRSHVSRWLRTTYAHNIAAEPQIRDIVPCVIAEQLLPVTEEESSVVDYKFWCFNGEPDFVYVISDRKGHMAHVMPYSLDWHPHPEWCVPTAELPLSQTYACQFRGDG